MSSFVLRFRDIDKTKLLLVGGKGANLGELSRIDGIEVPDGFCISTEAFTQIIAETRAKQLIDRLSLLNIDDRDMVNERSAEIRRLIEAIEIPQDIRSAITLHLSELGENNAYAIRSSATAEDSPTASFAGQQDTYLNIIGEKEILKHISKCWASLFTDRAVMYRIQNGYDHRNIALSVVVQKMVFPQVAGILFTADPVTSNRKVVSIDASFGLGEAVVSGLVNADVYKVSDGKIIDKKVGAKKLAFYASKEGGIEKRDIATGKQLEQALNDEQMLALERIGRKIEQHFGQPQDIEWCLSDDTFFFLQSRPITTLFPIPETNDEENHVYVSVGHQQMMTDAMKPLGLSLWQLTAARPMAKAGGRLFVDVTQILASPATRKVMVDVLGKSDPLIRDALSKLLGRDNFIKSSPGEQKEQAGSHASSLPDFQTLKEYDAAVVDDLITRSEVSIKQLKDDIKKRSGAELFDFILDDREQLRKGLSDPRSFGVIMTAMNASAWVNEKMMEWLGEKNVADTLSQSVPNNITSEMGLELLDVADVIRRHPEVIEYLKETKDDSFLEQLNGLKGGKEAREAINKFLEKFGMRCAGEIDITRPRWSERPLTIVPVILSNLKNFEPGESKRRFEQGRQQALKKEEELLQRLMELPDGEQKAKETKQMIGLIRNLSGYREYPKYSIVSRYFIYKQALLKEAERLVQAKVIHEKEDIYYLSFDELREVAQSGKVDYELIDKRKEEYKFYEKLTPPRVITSDGEIIMGDYRRDNLPANAIVGLPVSSGVIEGRARVILSMKDANLEDGDVLVTSFTDPSWTPLFVLIKGLVTEVGGLMTHGAVIAREYGLPAVVGVERATRLIKDGQRIRVNGTEGYIELL